MHLKLLDDVGFKYGRLVYLHIETYLYDRYRVRRVESEEIIYRYLSSSETKEEKFSRVELTWKGWVAPGVDIVESAKKIKIVKEMRLGIPQTDSRQAVTIYGESPNVQ